MLYKEIRKELLQTVRHLYAKEMIPLNSGNVSARASAEHFLITPRGIPYEQMATDDLVVINNNGEVIEGSHKPSSETPMHLAVYGNMVRAAAVVHTHSPYALAFAVAGRSIPIICTEGLAVRGPVPVAEYACPGTEAQGRVAVGAMQGPPMVTGTLLQNHGVLTYGATLSAAYATACRIEIAAKVYLLAQQIGTPQVLTSQQLDEIKALYASLK